MGDIMGGRVKRKCIYCSRESVRLTRSHIFTIALGRGFVLNRAVCEECQRRIKKVEDPILDPLRLLRSLLDLKGRHGLPPVIAEAIFRGKKQRVRLGPKGKPLPQTVLFFKVENGVYIFANDQKAGLKAKQRYQAAHPQARLTQLTPQVVGKPPVVRVPMDWRVFATDSARRFVAKVAFESHLRKCGVSIAHSPEYEEIKNFILYGKEGSSELANIFVDPSVEHIVQGLEFPNHFVFLQGTRPYQLIGIVSLFSLLFYWVRLSRTHSLMESAMCYVIGPQVGVVKEPLLLGSNIALLHRATPPIDWRKITSWWARNDPGIAADRAIRKLNAEIKRSSSKKPKP